MDISKEEYLAALGVAIKYCKQEAAKIPKDRDYFEEDPSLWREIRDDCREMLKAAKVDGHHGCLLCCS